MMSTLHAVLDLNDQRWKSFLGGYRVPYDASSILKRLYAEPEDGDAWSELWNELHHQGDVDLASYAAVPHLAKIQEMHRSSDWNAYALIATIEIEHYQPRNPPIPDWLAHAYRDGWRMIQREAIRDVTVAKDAERYRAIAAVLALSRGMLELGMLTLYFGDPELSEILEGFRTIKPDLSRRIWDSEGP